MGLAQYKLAIHATRDSASHQSHNSLSIGCLQTISSADILELQGTVLGELDRPVAGDNDGIGTQPLPE